MERPTKKATSYSEGEQARVGTTADKNGSMDYTLDGKVVDFEDGFRMSVGQEKVPARIRSFGGFGLGTLDPNGLKGQNNGSR